MPIDASRRTLEFIKAHENRDGGWGYRPGGMSYVEPTAFALLALRAGGEKTAAGTGLAFLRACQDEKGAMRAAPSGPPESWMAYAALLAFHELGASAEAGKLAAWILSFTDISSRLTSADSQAIRDVYRYDPSIPGWPWTGGTTAWLEPTALFILALARAGAPAARERIAAGVRLIIDRRVPSGGWNFGNPYNRSFEMPATVLSTSLALLALHAAGRPADDPAAASGLRFLERSLEGDASVAGLAWALLACKAYGPASPPISEWSRRLSALRGEAGGFRANPFEAALAWLALEDPRALIGAVGAGPGREGL